ncbi:putative nuclear protein involved in pre-rRNA processing [Aspergillus nomiae NRRL 13137]|uniref:rRNA-processing protein EFG1 n=1 Tax=Aspergillus nomiae NRRL (strain ATCC 15546 / NRRL 13137 / CBS 260.88 / M93) TaxID=1509407 RepID=A0A0L1IQA4_ASPN3|nr:putative nuclear protein involved in pre-rRNA processing [Aspergillus nomiae NRRL 13137]KNG81667.1 putative nuclear protein involved in pre-rRNA processing [Aspergillus nomiae NRRL 13137]
MPREYSRSQSPVARSSGDRHYRDRSDPPKRKHNSDEASHQYSRKKVQLPKKEHQYPSINELKKRIRDVKRLLNRVDLPADARIVQERALAGYENDLEEEENRRERSKMIKKYHFVRFLDRKTASKDVKRLERREKEVTGSDLDSATKEEKLAALAQKLQVARVNLNYTIYYPLAERYVALYADAKKKKDQAKDGDDDEDGDAKYMLVHANAADKPAMWHTVEKCMKDGTLELLRDGKLKNGELGAETTKKANLEKKKTSARDSAQHKDTTKTSVKPQRREDRKGKDSRGSASKNDSGHFRARQASPDDNGDESDGGFFEM